MTQEEYDNCPFCDGKMIDHPIFKDIRCTRCNWSMMFGDAKEEDKVRLFNEYAKHFRDERSDRVRKMNIEFEIEGLTKEDVERIRFDLALRIGELCEGILQSTSQRKSVKITSKIDGMIVEQGLVDNTWEVNE